MFKIIDCHLHIKEGERECISGLLKSGGLDGIAIASIPAGITKDCYYVNDKALKLKRKYSGKLYLFAGLDYSNREYLKGKVDFARQAEKLIASGADGIKMIEGKPDARKNLGIPLDSEILDSFYSYMEKSGRPILFHVADPEEFWDRKKVPEWAVKNGWFWGRKGYVSKEQLYKETEGVLKKFPKLKVIFAHFYFMSADIKRASSFFERWPNVCFDLTPGMEMYFNFTKKPQEWRAFFIRYQDRILFGSDNLGTCGSGKAKHLDSTVKHIASIRKFLETDEEMCSGRGLKLPQSALKKIYSGNFLRILAS
ncbi:MAG: hypothetical protein A2X49_10440 [Lentisphaerae bacterium GWF2_52_8]|nr:MAG: hypothetical protein A2X49_10440 [Lentisphaerae bacterium GWF2_52_8]